MSSSDLGWHRVTVLSLVGICAITLTLSSPPFAKVRKTLLWRTSPAIQTGTASAQDDPAKGKDQIPQKDLNNTDVNGTADNGMIGAKGVSHGTGTGLNATKMEQPGVDAASTTEKDVSSADGIRPGKASPVMSNRAREKQATIELLQSNFPAMLEQLLKLPARTPEEIQKLVSKIKGKSRPSWSSTKGGGPSTGFPQNKEQGSSTIGFKIPVDAASWPEERLFAEVRRQVLEAGLPIPEGQINEIVRGVMKKIRNEHAPPSRPSSSSSSSSSSSPSPPQASLNMPIGAEDWSEERLFAEVRKQVLESNLQIPEGRVDEVVRGVIANLRNQQTPRENPQPRTTPGGPSSDPNIPYEEPVTTVIGIRLPIEMGDWPEERLVAEARRRAVEAGVPANEMDRAMRDGIARLRSEVKLREQQADERKIRERFADPGKLGEHHEDQGNTMSESANLRQTATALMEEYDFYGDEDQLQEAIRVFREALNHCPVGHAERASSLFSLGDALRRYHEQVGNVEILGEMVALFREAVELQSPGDADHAASSSSLVNALSQLERAGDPDNLEQVILLRRELLALHPRGHPDRATWSGGLAGTLLRHYEQSATMETLVEAIDLLRETLLLQPIGHPSRGSSLNNLALALLRRNKQAEEVELVEDAIRLLRESLTLHPPDHPSHRSSLSNLAEALQTHFKEAGSAESLAEAIVLLKQALAMCPEGHSFRGTCLIDLSNALLENYQLVGREDLLEEPVRLLREALALHPGSHPAREGVLTNLAKALTRLGDREALSGALNVYRELVSMQPEGHSERGTSLCRASDILVRRFWEEGNQEALEDALKLRKEMLIAWPEGHSERHHAHHRISQIQLLDTSLFNWTEALDHLTQGVADESVPARTRVRLAMGSLRSVEDAAGRDPDQYLHSQPALDIYSQVVRLLPSIVQEDSPTSLQDLAGIEQFCRTAAMRAALLNRIATAIELFEEGKVRSWSEALQLPSITSRQHPPSGPPPLDLLGIRGNVPQFEVLQQAAADGIVVALIAEGPTFFAITVDATKAPQLVKLPSLSRSMLRKLVKQATTSVMRNRDRTMNGGSSDAGSTAGNRDQSERSSLAQIWQLIVHPIITGLLLQKAEGRQRRRVHWYPSGDFAKLSIHAAGNYEDQSQDCVSDYLVSSYTTSLTALIKSREGFTPLAQHDIKALVYHEPGTPGQPDDSSVGNEVRAVIDVVTSKMGTIINGVDTIPTVKTAIEQIPAAHLLHLSCHGQQNSDPLACSFALKDGPLMTSALMGLQVPNAVLAFLSPNNAVKEDKNQSDQPVPLAASMLFCGFRSVIATMWSVHDEDCSRMAQWFYEALFENETIELDDIPHALDAAVQELRGSGAPISRWATYVHWGA